MIYKVTEVISAGNIETRYGMKAKAVVMVEGWPKPLDYWGQTFVQDMIDAEIKPNKNPQYNDELKKVAVPKATAPRANSAAIGQAMERKEKSIENFQDNKEKSIQHAGAITNATNLLVAMIGEGKLYGWEQMSEDQIKAKLRELIIFYQNLYKHPEDINPSSSDQPF